MIRNKIVYTPSQFVSFSELESRAHVQVYPGQAANESPSSVEQSFLEFYGYFRVGGEFVYR
jgi:hypothetical protein